MKRRRPRRPRLTYASRIILWIMLPALILLTVRLIWGWQADRRLAHLRERLHDQGLRIYPTDYPDPRAIPANQNAAVGVAEALALFQSSHLLATSLESLRHDSAGQLDADRTPQETRNLRTLAIMCRPALDKLDEALHRPQTIWPRPPDRAVRYAYNDPSNLLCNLALLAHADHDDAETLHQLWLALQLAAMLSQAPDRNVSSSSLGRARSALDVLERLAPELDLRGPAVATQARAVLEVLQENIPQRVAESSFQATLPDLLESPAYPRSDDYWMLRPLTKNQRARLAESLVAQRASNQALNYQVAKKLENTTYSLYGPTGDTQLDYMLRIPRTSSLSSSRQFEALTAQRAVMLLLAAHLYAARHSAPADRAALLVPEILPAIPLDPYAANDQPLHYRLLAGVPSVWSVGPTGADDITAGTRGDDAIFGAGHFPPIAPTPPTTTTRP